MKNNIQDITHRTDSAVIFLRTEKRLPLEKNGKDINKDFKRLVPLSGSHAAGESRRALYYCVHIVPFL